MIISRVLLSVHADVHVDNNQSSFIPNTPLPQVIQHWRWGRLRNEVHFSLHVYFLTLTSC